MSFLAIATAAVIMVAAVHHGCSAAYCDENLYTEDEECRPFAGVRFTKELSMNEYGPLGSFKTLHCCGERYLSLEWFKDNRPYPWPGDVSSFILNPESANQTIYTTSLTSSDHGFYTCQLVNQMNILNHSMKLATIDDLWGNPLLTYQIPKEHYAKPGDSVRLYCEGFVGKVNLPDAVNTIKWKKVDGNQTIKSNDRYRIVEVIRENNEVLGAFLFINEIQQTDYGQYVCSISNTDDQIVQQFINITKPVVYNEQSNNKVHRDLKLIVFVMLALILIVWKRQWFCSAYHTLKKKFENKKYALSEKTVHNVIVFYDEENKESAEYLVEKMEHRDNYMTKKYHINFDNAVFNKTHADLIKAYDFAIYLLSSNITITSSLMAKLIQKPFVLDKTSPKKYIIDCDNTRIMPTKSWCDRVLEDLNGECMHAKQNQTYNSCDTPNKLIRVVSVKEI